MSKLLKPFGALARLWGRTDNAVIQQLFTHCIGQPLLIEPRLGAQLLAAYMAGPLMAVDYGPPRQKAGKIAVMNISGALAPRPMPGPSGDGPQNYEEISATFAELVDAPDVESIVLRLDTPGGFASGLFDFTDQIFAARKTKPVHAVVDDTAYSAGYAIAAAADQVWISRTGGVGSVGVVLYHVDQSEANKAEGIKITPIFAGDKKIDLSPNFPLSERAAADAQLEVDRLYDLFVGQVAKYRGDRLNEKAVRASEAGLFSGPNAPARGFADRVGTLHDALAFLGAAEKPNPGSSRPAQPEGQAPMADEAQATAQRVKGVLALAIMAAKLPAAISAALLAIDVPEPDIEKRVAHAREVLGLCEVAKLQDRAEGFVSRHVAVDDVRKELQAVKADAGDRNRVEPTLPPISGNGGNGRVTAFDKAIRKLGGTQK